MSAVENQGEGYPAHLAAILPASGMTLRDWFAGQALAGIMANHDGLKIYCIQAGNSPAQHAVARDAYLIADAMLAARARGDAA